MNTLHSFPLDLKDLYKPAPLLTTDGTEDTAPLELWQGDFYLALEKPRFAMWSQHGRSCKPLQIIIWRQQSEKADE